MNALWISVFPIIATRTAAKKRLNLQAEGIQAEDPCKITEPEHLALFGIATSIRSPASSRSQLCKNTSKSMSLSPSPKKIHETIKKQLLVCR